MASTLRVLPLGGLGEIGKNMMVLEYEGRIVVVDVGLRFPTAEMVGIDLVLPDFSYLRDRVDDIEAIVVTHGHEDHLGALPWVLRELGTDIPVFAGPLTTAMARSKLDEHRLRDVYAAMFVTASPAPVKAALSMLGHRVGGLRLPLVECDEDELEVVRAALERHGLLEAAGR